MRILNLSARLLAAACIALAAPAAVEAGDRERALRDRVIAALRQRLPKAEIKVLEDAAFEVREGDRGPATAYVDNLLRRLEESPGDEAELISRYVTVLEETLSPAPPSLERIVSVVRTRAWLKAYEAAMQGTGARSLMHRPLLGDLVEVIAHNDAASFAYRGRDELLTLGAEDQLWIRARKNAADQMGELSREEIARGLEAVFAPDSALASSLVLDPAFCARTPPPVAAVEGRGLVVTDATKREVVEMLRKVHAEPTEDPDASTTLLTCRDGKLASYPR